MNILELSEQEIGRRQSLQELRNMGIDPYPAAEFPVNATSEDIKANFKDDEKREVTIAGRLMTKRIMGKASFAELQDGKGRIQLYISRDDLCPGEDKDLYNKVFKKLMDIGDIVGVKGYAFRTQMGEISVHVEELTLLSKSLKPLPIVKYKDGVAYDKFDDPEMRARRGWLHGGGDTHIAGHCRRCQRTSVHHPFQRARHRHVHAYRDRALSEATHRGWLRWRV